MKNKILKQMVMVFISFLILFTVIPMTASAANSTAGLFAGKYSKAQIFEGWGNSMNWSTYQSTGMLPTANERFTFTDLNNIYDANIWVNSKTLSYIDWGANNDRYVQFVDAATDNSTKYSNAYTVKLNLYEADGTLVKTISNYGTVWGLSEVGFLYQARDSRDYFISNSKGYPYMQYYGSGPTISYTPTNGIVTNVADLNNYAANTTVLGAGETIAGKAAIATAKGLMPTSIMVTEGADTNLLNYLNAISGMSATGVTLSLESANTNVAADGTIIYTSSAVTGDVIVKINKTNGIEASQTIAITVPAHITAAERANAAIAAAQALLPATFTAAEETTTNLLDYLNGLPGMSATETTLTIESANDNVATDGTISYTASTVTGNVTVKINKTNGTEVSRNIAVTIPAHAQKIYGDYVLIVNESLTQSQQIGTISFDHTNPFGSSTATNSLSVNEDEYQQAQLDVQQSETSSANDITPFGSSDAMQGLSENEDRLTFNTQAVTKTYTIGETKDMLYPTNKFTVTGIGENCVIWMDDALIIRYTSESLSTAMASIIDSYENNAYPALKRLGADTKMYYADGSGKLSIFIRNEFTSPHFSHYDIPYNGITGIHISASAAPTDLSKYTLAIAHEGQHALNASTQNMSIWIDEGLSTAIMHDVSWKMNNYQYNSISLPWLDQCVQDIRVKSGAGLARTSTVGNSMIDYSIPYLYLRYLSNQVNGEYNYDSDFFSKLYSVDASTSGLTGISRDAYIIEQVLKQYDCFKNPDGTTHWSFQQSFANFRIAAFKQDATGIYGFYGDPTVAHNFGIGGPALYFNATDKDKTIEPTGAIIVKTRNGSFDIPSDAGADIKFIAFDVEGQLPANRRGTWYAGGEMNTVYKGRPITFDNLRVVKTDAQVSGKYGPVYQGLSEIYAANLQLVAYYNDPYLQRPIPYTLGELPTNIPNGSHLLICDPSKLNDYYNYRLVYLGKVIVKDVLKSIPALTARTGVDNGVIKTVNGLGIPWNIPVVTTGGNVNAAVTWDVDASSYDVSTKTEQTFTVNGTVTLPDGVVNLDNVPLTTTIQVTVSAQKVLLSLTPPTAITGVANGTAKTANALKLPPKVTMNTTGGPVPANVIWNVDVSTYYVPRKTEQIFNVAGTVYLPSVVFNPNNVPLTTTITVTVSAQKVLVSITPPTAITGVANGSAKTATGLGLPSTVTMLTDGGDVNAPVTWAVDSSSYTVATKTEQNFPVNGTVNMPTGVVNTNNVSQNITIQVTVSAQKVLVSITPPTAITGVANGSAKTPTGLGLPSTVTMVTDGGIVSATVMWDAGYSIYNPDITTEQTFPVTGRVNTLPTGVVNTNNVSQNITIQVTVSAQKVLQSITVPTAIIGVVNGTAKTAAALGLPSTVTLLTSDGSVSAPVSWELESANYDASVTTEQIFTVNGTVTLPSGVENTNSVTLTTSISVTVNDVRHVTIDECFIATAAFGSKFTPAVVLLRQFRDNYLLTNGLGQAFVDLYYKTSPPIAQFIAGNETLKGVVRIALIPAIATAYMTMNPLLGIVFILLMAAVWFGYRRRKAMRMN